MCIEREKVDFKSREVNCLKECALALSCERLCFLIHRHFVDVADDDLYFSFSILGSKHMELMEVEECGNNIASCVASGIFLLLFSYISVVFYLQFPYDYCKEKSEIYTKCLTSLVVNQKHIIFTRSACE